MTGFFSTYAIPTLRAVNDVLTAAAAIVAFSFILFSLQFIRRGRLTRAFIPLLLCVVIIYSADALEIVTLSSHYRLIWQKIHWTGFIFLAPAFLYFSLVLINLTGVSLSRREQIAMVASLPLSLIFVWLLWTDRLFSGLLVITDIGTTMRSTRLTLAFWIYFGVLALISFALLYLTLRRARTRTGRRRMRYLILGSLGIFVGTFPLLLFGSGLMISSHPWIFWTLSVLCNIMVVLMIFLLGYSVATFSVSWSDRMVRLQMIEWMLRGPFTASVTLGVVTLINRGSGVLGVNITGLNTLATMVCIVLLEFLIGKLIPHLERNSLTGYGAEDYEIYKQISQMMVFKPELAAYLEALVSALVERFRAKTGFAAVLDDAGETDPLIEVGGSAPDYAGLLPELLQSDGMVATEDIVLVPVIHEDENVKLLLGVIGMSGSEADFSDVHNADIIDEALQKARSVLWQRRYLTTAYATVKQNSAADASDYFRQGHVLNRSEMLGGEQDLEQVSVWVKDALSHYWGGPRMTESPLLTMKVVKKEIEDGAENPVNALRSVLKKAIERLRPEGPRSFTGEWTLYNILDMKFLEKQKVKDISSRLAMSEADFYRKQKVAVENVAKEIIRMENEKDE